MRSINNARFIASELASKRNHLVSIFMAVLPTIPLNFRQAGRYRRLTRIHYDTLRSYMSVENEY